MKGILDISIKNNLIDIISIGQSLISVPKYDRFLIYFYFGIISQEIHILQKILICVENTSLKGTLIIIIHLFRIHETLLFFPKEVNYTFHNGKTAEEEGEDNDFFLVPLSELDLIVTYLVVANLA